MRGNRHLDIQGDVQKVLDKHGEALDSYRALTLWFWTDVDKGLSYDPKTATFTLYAWNCHRLSSPESISRAFRRVLKRNVAKYGVMEERWRRREEERYREAYSHSEKNPIPRVMKRG